MNALLSVSDKTGLIEFARGLSALGIELYASGGTERALQDAGIAVHPLQELTGFVELLDGRVKTLHPHVHAGILARREEPRHMQELKDRGVPPIDLVVANLYPFQETVRSGHDGAQALEAIDIGGVALLRAAAKNYAHVLAVVRPGDYPKVLEELRRSEGPSPEFRRHLAAIAFAHTATYDAAIAEHLRPEARVELPPDFSVAGRKVRDLRYGENPHQVAALYRGLEGGGLAEATQRQGLELSYNNLLDAQAAWALVSDLDDPAAAIIKHANPCGVACAGTPREAYERALQCDPRSAFGGILALNRPLDGGAAEVIVQTFLEVVVAPGFDDGATGALQRRPKLRVLEPGRGDAMPAFDARLISGGFLLQSADRSGHDLGERRVVTQRQPDDAAWGDLQFAWTVVKHVRSNAIVVAKDRTSVGVGAGQMSRVEAVEMAVRRAGDRAHSAVLASDGFFPYPDGVEAAAAAGVTAVVQPGGSVKDSDVIAAADRAGIAMVFTGDRHFRH
jgi:phosphoribosylaminoimidazolecarboxamide formyltransferase/IMP cyclohydrolase